MVLKSIKMPKVLRTIVTFWSRHISPRLETLISAVGFGGLGICLLLIWILAKLSREIWERESFSFDTSFLLWLHQFANPILDKAMVTITQLGNPSVVIPVAIITLGVLVGSRQRSAALLFAIACLGSAILNTGLKLVFIKPRPELWHRLIVETSYSYPSGHALGSMVLYGMIAYLLSQRYPKFSNMIYVAAAGLISTICFSRLYLGVHWLTDIIAGLGIGFLWLVICITMLKLQSLRERTRTKFNSR
jgi:membrane-associated phospholipid phosphatase